MPQTETAPVLNPAALSGIRFLVGKRIEEMEAVTEALDREIDEATASTHRLAGRLERLEAQWQGLLRSLPATPPDELDGLFREVAAARANLAAASERHDDAGEQLRSLRSELEALRAIHRSLDDLMGATSSPEEGTERLRSASRQVFQIIEEERMRIARDMHDGPAQSMANLVLQAEILEKLIARDPKAVVSELIDFKTGVRDVLDETRRLIFDLRPMTLDDLGLVPTLRKFVKEFGDRARVAATLRVVGEEVRLPGSLEPTIFRIVQEALNNARKHARASTVEVTIIFQPRSVTAVVKDDGVGMDVEETEATLDSSRHLGLISMRERADLEKGRLEIRSQPGHGTEVRVSFDT